MLDVFFVVVRLSRHCGLTFTLDNCHDKLINIAKNLSMLRQTFSRLYRFIVITKFSMSQSTFSRFHRPSPHLCRDKLSSPFALYCVATNFGNVATNF